MTKAKQKTKPARKRKRAPVAKARPARSAEAVKTASELDSAPAADVSYGALSLHQLFEQQTRQMLDRTDLDEEQKQNILVALSCPCCGAGGMSYTAKLKR
jgi:hypothetical protein